MKQTSNFNKYIPYTLKNKIEKNIKEGLTKYKNDYPNKRPKKYSLKLNKKDSIIELKYPGKKPESKYDFVVEYSGEKISHENIAFELFNIAYSNKEEPNSIETLQKSLYTLASKGLSLNTEMYLSLPLRNNYYDELNTPINLLYNGNAENSKNNINYIDLFILIFFIAIQEEINYPISKKKEGRKMPFKRYFEAIIWGSEGSFDKIQELQERIDCTIPPPNKKSMEKKYELYKKLDTIN
jgi:hypothetical protein